MSEPKVQNPIKLDLHAAMGDPQALEAVHVPGDSELRARVRAEELSIADYWFLRGYGHYLERDFQLAVESLNMALLHDPSRSEGHFIKGICLQLLGLAAAETYPGFPAHVPARAHDMLLKARWAFQIVLELNPTDDEARTYLIGLEALLR